MACLVDVATLLFLCWLLLWASDHAGMIACFLPTEGLEELVKQKGFQDGIYTFEYYPSTPGKYSVAITWGGHHIPKR